MHRRAAGGTAAAAKRVAHLRRRLDSRRKCNWETMGANGHFARIESVYPPRNRGLCSAPRARHSPSPQIQCRTGPRRPLGSVATRAPPDPQADRFPVAGRGDVPGDSSPAPHAGIGLQSTPCPRQIAPGEHQPRWRGGVAMWAPSTGFATMSVKHA